MLSITILALLGCPDTDKDTDDEDAVDVCDPHELACEDELVSLLLNEDKSSNGAVTTTTEGDDFVTLVDATAGGQSAATGRAWVYLRFTAEGAERVDITDGASLTSQDWHMALRRYQLRLNSGVSGPSCVTAASVRSAYADLGDAPEADDFSEESFFDDACVKVTDDQLGDPLYLLTGWWSYGECLEPTLQAYAVQLDDGSVIKLVVESYYADQAACSDAESGWITMRWAYL